MRHYFLNSSKKQKYIFAMVDVVVISIAIFISYCLRIYLNTGVFSLDKVLIKIKLGHALIIPVHMLTLYILNLYSLKKMGNPIRMAMKIVISVIVGALIISGCLFFFPKYVFGRQVLLYHTFVLSLLLVFCRLVLFKTLGFFQKEKRVALVCSSKIAKIFIAELSKSELSGFKISHILNRDNQNQWEAECLSQNDMVFYSSLEDLLEDNQFDILGFDSSNASFSNKEIQLILETRQKNKEVYDIPNLYQNLTGKVPLGYIDGRWLLSREGLQGVVSRSYLKFKRIFDVFISFLLIILCFPFFVMVSIAIKIESKGKVIFSQERLGVNRQPFICYKFRTMVENAEEMSGPVWADSEDSRVTKLGRFLRKSRLDELPQLWNILKGNISFVGPRPIRKYFADKLSQQIPFYELRFSIQPGLSGWAQVRYGYAGSENGQLEKFQYELYYIQNMSLLLDIIIVFKTIQSIFKGEGN
jgi:exopolysaccharide biosynthesis polyprenyl glycosylphosphotransferase